MSSILRAERTDLIALLARLGPDAATLCTGWKTADLAAHLVARQRRPDSLPGLVVPAMAGWTEKIRRAYLAQGYPKLVTMLEHHPPWWARNATLQTLDLVEWFVHHEDVRRCATDWRARQLPRKTGEALWAGQAISRLLLRKARLTVAIEAPGFGRRTVGTGPVQATVTGDPAEITLFCFGRQAHARVEVTGGAARELRNANLGV